MNKSPLNYLITIALGVILWVATAIMYGGSFSESLVLASTTPEAFLANFRIVLALATVAGIGNSLYWFYYGNLDSTAGKLSKAKKVWWISFITQLIISVACLFILVIVNLTEGILTKDWLVIYMLISLHAWVFFWLCTFLMSPRTVQYIPLFK